VEKAAVLLIYIIAVVITLVSVRCKLHRAAMVTISLFLLCLLSTFIAYTFNLYNVLPGDSEGKNRLLYEILIPVSKGVLLGIQYFYTFEIRVVLLKVLSDTPLSYLKERFKSLVILSAGFVILTLSYALEIFEHIDILEGQGGNVDNKVFIILIRLLMLSTELPLFWFLFSYLRKFSEIRRENGGLTSRRSKVVLNTIYFLLAINAANTVAYNTTQLIIGLSSDSKKAKEFEDTWLVFSTIITDGLVFVNAIAFLMLFKSLKSGRNSHKVKRPAIMSSLNHDNRLSDSSNGTIATQDIKLLLQFGGNETPRQTQYSKDPESKTSSNDSRPLMVRPDSTNSSNTSYSEAENPLQDYLLALVNRSYL
jgi:hypothetical protein